MLSDEVLLEKKDAVAWLIAWSLALYIASFFLPANGFGKRLFYGWQAFFLSLFEFLENGNPVCFANLGWCAAVFLFFRGKTGNAFSVLSILAFVFALAGFEISDLRIGYYAWLTSHFLLAAAGSTRLVQRSFQRDPSRRLQRRQFSLRALLAITSVVALVLAITVIPMKRINQQRNSVSLIQALNGEVGYGLERSFSTRFSTRSSLRRLIQFIYGPDAFRKVVRVSMGDGRTSIDDLAVRALSSLHSLEYLSLDNAHLSGDGADGLANLQSLVHLTLSNSVVAEGAFERLKLSPTLRELSLYRVPLSPKLFEELASLRNVKLDLTIHSTVSVEEMSALSCAENIHTISFGAATLSPEAWVAMQRMTGLRKLNFYSMPLSGPAFEALGRQTQLRVLSMHGVQVSDETWADLPRSEHLKDLLLHRMSLSASACEAIGKQFNLEYLNLNDTSIVKGGLKSIRQFSSLKTLALHRTGVASEELQHINQLRQLVRLELRATRVDDEIYGALSEMSSLKILNLTRTLVSQATADRLKADLPNCRVDF